MALTVRGILSFNDLFVPKAIKTSPGSVPKFQAVILFPPNCPEAAKVKAEFDRVALEKYPSSAGTLPANAKGCFGKYHDRYYGKDYYNPELAEWFVLSTTAQADDRPHVVDASVQKILNAGHEGLVPGSLVDINFNISGYDEGTGGVGGWLNGIMATGQMGQLGRLDNKPSAEQMFGGGSTQSAPAAGGTPPPPSTPGVGAPPPPPSEGPIMTDAAKAAGYTYESLQAAQWTDQQMVDAGYLVPPASFS